MSDSHIVEHVAAYYADKLRRHGASARGVDWRDEASQQLRFEQLMTVVRGARDVSVTDFGCGYGELLAYLRQTGFTGRYVGIDIAEPMIAAARARFPDDASASFALGASADVETDYAVASGIFNVRLGFSADRWERHVCEALEEMSRVARVGFAVNFLTSYSDPERMRPDLYYADPKAWLDYCIGRFGRRVAILHDYGLYEFTLLVRKPPAPPQ